jgi:putative transposase
LDSFKWSWNGLKKSQWASVEDRRGLVDSSHEQLSIVRQCELLGISRSGYYYKPEPISEKDLVLQRLLDEQYTRTPFYGSRRMVAWLKLQGYEVNRKHIRRLMQELGLEAIYPKPNLSRANVQHTKYPYLLRDILIEEANQVWSTDITYIRMKKGFVYLVAVIDWFSRYVLSWEVSNTLDTGFCLEALSRALKQGKPSIFNTDQGVQFTSHEFVGQVLQNGIRVSMDGRGRALDNIFVERLWRSVKYEEVYLKDYQTVPEALQGLGNYFHFYNHERLHQALGYQTPFQVHVASQEKKLTQLLKTN